MKVTISEPTPVPEMPKIVVVAYPGNDRKTWYLSSTTQTEHKRNKFAKDNPGSRLITIDPDAPSFEPGPLEWMEGDCPCRIERVEPAQTMFRLHDGCGGYSLFSNTRTDIGHLIRALVTAYNAAPENS